MRFPGGYRDDRGATAVEYGLIVALIAVVVVASVALLGSNLAGLFSDSGDTIGAAVAGEQVPGQQDQAPQDQAPQDPEEPIDLCVGLFYSSDFSCDPSTGVITGGCPTGFTQPAGTYTCVQDQPQNQNPGAQSCTGNANGQGGDTPTCASGQWTCATGTLTNVGNGNSPVMTCQVSDGTRNGNGNGNRPN